MDNNITYLKTDDDKIINETCIIWVKKINECLDVCTKSIGCHGDFVDTHKICKKNNKDSYDKLNKHFEYKSNFDFTPSSV